MEPNPYESPNAPPKQEPTQSSPHRPKWQTPLAITLAVFGVAWGLLLLNLIHANMGSGGSIYSEPPNIVEIIEVWGFCGSPCLFFCAVMLYVWPFHRKLA